MKDKFGNINPSHFIKARLAEGSLNTNALENLREQSRIEENLDEFEADVESLMNELKELKQEIVGESKGVLVDWLDNKTEKEVFQKFK